MSEPARDVGRPTDYKDEYAKQAENACMAFGAKDSELAEYFGVCEATLNTWKKEYPEFLESIKRGKEDCDIDVVRALLKRASGFETVEVRKEGDKTVTTTREVPPDTAAAIIWLKNRRPKQWRDRNYDAQAAADGLGLLLEAISNNSRGLPRLIEQETGDE